MRSLIFGRRLLPPEMGRIGVILPLTHSLHPKS